MEKEKTKVDELLLKCDETKTKKGQPITKDAIEEMVRKRIEELKDKEQDKE